MTEEFIYPADQFLLIGKIVKPHGIQGEVKIYSYSEQPENFLGYKHLVLVNEKGTLSSTLDIKKCRIHGKMAIVKIASVTNRNQAENLQGMGVLLDKDVLPQATEEEYYWYQLQGLTVKTMQGNLLGIVKHVFSNGAQDIMVIDDGNSEYMVPIHTAIIVEQNDKGIVINPPPGLLEIYSRDDI